jgi:hypothetical protein
MAKRRLGRLTRLIGIGTVLIVGGGLPWVVGFASFSLLQNHPPLLLVWQTLMVPVLALTSWSLLNQLSPAPRLSAALLCLSIWLAPGLWLASSDVGRSGWASLKELPTLLWRGPIILSLSMMTSLGLATAFVALGGVVFWKRRETPRGA